MKNCIYLTVNKLNSMWYIGSHKNDENVINKSYLGSGSEILRAVENDGVDNFTSEILFTFNDRNAAFKGEHQILNALNAKGDSMSYNQTNNSWPKEGFFQKTFGSKIGPLTNAQIDEVRKRFKPVSGSAKEKEGSTFQDLIKSMEKQCFSIGQDLGQKYGIEHQIENNITIQRNTMLDSINFEIYLIKSNIDKLKIIIDHNSDDLEAKIDLSKKENSIKYYESLLADKENKTGWYNSFDCQYKEGIKEGMRKYLINKIRLQNGK